MSVVLPVKFRHSGVGIRGVVAKFLLRLAFLIAGRNVIVPFFNVVQRILQIRYGSLTGGHGGHLLFFESCTRVHCYFEPTAISASCQHRRITWRAATLDESS